MEDGFEADKAEALAYILESSYERAGFAFSPTVNELYELVTEGGDKDAGRELATAVREKALFLVEMADAFLGDEGF
jgi:hypothetical protein